MAQPDNEEITSTEDFLFNYHRSKLLFGLTLFEFDDAIKEGENYGGVYQKHMLYTCYCISLGKYLP